MTVFLLDSNITVSGANAQAFTGPDQVYLKQGVLIASIGTGLNYGIFKSGAGNFFADIQGSVLGYSGINLSGNTGTESNIVIGQTGSVTGHNDDGLTVTEGKFSLVNHGQVNGLLGEGLDLFGTGTATIWNHGSITGGSDGIEVNTATRTITLFNFGAIDGQLGRGVLGFSGNDYIFNEGTITGLSEAVNLGGGNDIYDGSNGTVLDGGTSGRGTVRGGAGNDLIFGGDGREELLGEANNDTIRGGGGGDFIDGGDNDDDLNGQGGTDRVFGAGGNDTIYFDADDLLYGDIDGGSGYDSAYNVDDTTPITFAMTSENIEAYFGSAADEVIIAGSLGGFGAFVRTGAGNDLFDGSEQADNVDGGLGVDVLYGRGGNDDIVGGLGGDWLQGGAGADVFDYFSLTDSTVNGQDFIADFSTAQGDKIGLAQALPGAVATFNSGFGTGVSVYVFANGGGTSLVQAYVGATLQMQLVVNQATLAVTDFVL